MEKPEVKAAPVPVKEESEEDDIDEMMEAAYGDEDEKPDESEEIEPEDSPTDPEPAPVPLPIVVPIIHPKVLERPQVWGIFGDWKDLMDPAGMAFFSKYDRHLYEFCVDVD